ncbi:hypothetical protein [Thiolapillus sp.]|uniref:hypothetical protein n=2 Tax=Thiolapillus sp. TaxID=2017437 RepID=UPI0025D61E6E|nr:hypothetical protein [Thiolapillus sp.]
MAVPTYEQRVARMKRPEDVDRELKRAKAYMMRLRGKMKKAASLDEKIQLEKDIKLAESVLRQLRLNIYELEDQLGGASC